MAGEGDQTKWTGIRPTNPPENIPVTESSPVTEVDINPAAGMGTLPVAEQTPLSDILVAPSAGDPVFLTATEKRSPAIGDLQAPSAFVRVSENKYDVGAATYDHDIYTVPSGKMFLLDWIEALCFQATPTYVQFVLRSGGSNFLWYRGVYGLALTIHAIFPKVLYDEDEIVRISWGPTDAATDVKGAILGYLMDKY